MIKRQSTTDSKQASNEYLDIIRIANADEYESVVDQINRLDPNLSDDQCLELINAVFDNLHFYFDDDINVFENTLACVMSSVLSPHFANQKHRIQPILLQISMYKTYIPDAENMLLQLLSLGAKISISYIRDGGGKLNRSVLDSVCRISKQYPRITNALLQHEDYNLLRTEAFWCGTNDNYRRQSIVQFSSSKGLDIATFLLGHYIYQLGLYMCDFDEVLFELAGWKMIEESHKNPSFAYALVEAKKTLHDVIVEVTEHSQMPRDICVMISEYTVFTDRAQRMDMDMDRDRRL
jgi:hypothetical protein